MSDITPNSTGAPRSSVDGDAPELSYDVPQDVSYSGQNYIELQLPDGYFRASAVPSPSQEDQS
jgi:hypothetical protein